MCSFILDKYLPLAKWHSSSAQLWWNLSSSNWKSKLAELSFLIGFFSLRSPYHQLGSKCRYESPVGISLWGLLSTLARQEPVSPIPATENCDPQSFSLLSKGKLPENVPALEVLSHCELCFTPHQRKYPCPAPTVNTDAQYQMSLTIGCNPRGSPNIAPRPQNSGELGLVCYTLYHQYFASQQTASTRARKSGLPWGH
jgi:hypothetical protein